MTTDRRRKLKPIHLLHPHRDGCFTLAKEHRTLRPWCCPEASHVDLRRHKTRPVGVIGGSPVLIFRCLDSSCGAQLAVRMEFVEATLGLHKYAVRNLGKELQ